MDPRFDDFEKRISALEKALKGKGEKQESSSTEAPKKPEKEKAK